MALLRAGIEIDAYCTRCRMDLTHRIIAVVNNKPVKVECRTCYGTHNYRAPKSSAVPAAKSAGGASAPRASKPSPRRSAAAAEEHITVAPPPGARIHGYRMTDKFSKDQWVSHKVFGTGVVTQVLGDDKIEVHFDGNSKVLVHNRPEDP
jgi:hypothetical protein